MGYERSATGPVAAKEPLPRLQHASTGLEKSPRKVERTPRPRRLSISELTLPAGEPRGMLGARDREMIVGYYV